MDSFVVKCKRQYVSPTYNTLPINPKLNQVSFVSIYPHKSFFYHRLVTLTHFHYLFSYFSASLKFTGIRDEERDKKQKHGRSFSNSMIVPADACSSRKSKSCASSPPGTQPCLEWSSGVEAKNMSERYERKEKKDKSVPQSGYNKTRAHAMHRETAKLTREEEERRKERHVVG